MDSKRLIEVSLPLEAINRAASREKSIRHGHPSTLHLWWARRPLAAARAVIFAQMVDDPSEYVDVLLSDVGRKRAAERELKERLADYEKKQLLSGEDTPVGPELTIEGVAGELERKRLFGLIEELVRWENTTNEEVLERARSEIWQSWRWACARNADHPRAKELYDRHKLPAFHDPFAGGGALPLEAQRLGLESHASDLNPVAVLINKATIEIPPRFAGRGPVNPEARQGGGGDKPLLAEREWRGAQGLAEDVRYYGRWMRGQAEKRIGHLYPKVEVTEEMVKERPDLKPYQGRKLTVIAWLWARTVKSPNPAYADVEVPLASTFMLSTKKGKEAYVEPVMEGSEYRFEVKVGKPADMEAVKAGTKMARGANFKCLMSGTAMAAGYIRSEAQAGRMGSRLMAIVAEGDRGRIYLAPVANHEAVPQTAKPSWKPDLKVPTPCHDVDRLPMYGMPTWGDAFTPRQLVALTTFSDLVAEATEHVKNDCLRENSTIAEDGRPLRDGGAGPRAYAEAVGVYLAFAQSKACDRNTSLCRWEYRDKLVGTFSRQALPMVWDYAETNPFAGAGGDILGTAKSVCEVIEKQFKVGTSGFCSQVGAVEQSISANKLVSTDPPYYDNVGYADLSDFFYVWLRRQLRPIFPDLFATVAVPKAGELVATPYRHESKDEADAFFLGGMTDAMRRIVERAHPGFPVTIYYAFKQSETKGDTGTSSTGWETFLNAVIRAGFSVTGTWPMRTELGNRMVGMDTNALASSIILVCRHRPDDAPLATRREFVAALKAELPLALAHLQVGNIAPVDLAQAAIGPGMAVYTRYAKVLDAEGKPVPVRDALALINQTLDETLAEQEGEFDADTRWALAWFEQQGFGEGEYGVAEMLSKAKNTSIAGIAQRGILVSRAGKVRLLRPKELADDWDPTADSRLTVWEVVHQLVRVLESGGETQAAAFLRRLGGVGETARELAYRLYSIAERKGRPAEALAYNSLVQSWPEIIRLARSPEELELL